MEEYTYKACELDVRGQVLGWRSIVPEYAQQAEYWAYQGEAETDGMWSFVHDKSQQYWLWWAIDH